MTQLLVEALPPSVFSICEATKEERANGWMRVRGRFQLAETKNGNGRIYPLRLWQRVLESRELQERLRSNQMRGELEHPADGVTNISRVSHIVTGLTLSGNEVLGEALILGTPAGKILQELFRAKSPVGVSSRGRGSSKVEGGAEIVQDDYVPDTWDFVDRPSTPGAYPALVEALDGPYKLEASMDAKRAEILAHQVRAHNILKEAVGADLAALDRFAAELVEGEAKVQTLAAQKDELKPVAQDAQAVVTEARSMVQALRDKAYAEQGHRLAVRVEEARRANGNGAAQAGLLEELDRTARYWRDQAESLAKQLRRGAVPGRRYQASLRLGEALVKMAAFQRRKLREAQKALEAAEKKCGAFRALVAEILVRNDEGKRLARIREALEDNPKLARFRPVLEKIRTLKDLDESIRLHSQAIREMDGDGGAAPEAPGGSAVTLKCDGCGHTEEVDPDVTSMECPECGGNMAPAKAEAAPPPKAPEAPTPPATPAKTEAKEPPKEPAVKFESALPSGPPKEAAPAPSPVPATPSSGPSVLVEMTKQVLAGRNWS
jgi:hypothetical protein